MHNANYTIGPIHARGALTVDFALPGSVPLNELAPVIERDRMHMAKRPGLRHKHLPIRVDPGSGNFLSGGRYLFDTLEHAEQYRSWAENEFILDGIRFFDRPFFLDPVYHTWNVIGAQDWADMHTSHAVIRSERWRLAPGRQDDLKQAWPLLCKEAETRGLASVWLLHNEPEQLTGLISIGNRLSPGDPRHPDDASLHALESSQSLGSMLAEAGCEKVFDLTSWVLTIWFPLVEGEPDIPALWPNSPPWPAPVTAMAAP